MTPGEAAVERLRHHELFRHILVEMLIHKEDDLTRDLDQAIERSTLGTCDMCSSGKAEICRKCANQ